jgi:hypothetical protein
MPNRNDYRGYGGDRDPDRSRHDDGRARREGGERRTFGDPGRYDYGRGQYDVEPNAGDDLGYGSRRTNWRPAGGSPYDPSFDARDLGVREYGPPADYAYRPPAGHEFDPEYVRWRDAQLDAHDRDYAAWRRAQHEQYDHDYRDFHRARREDFTRRFQSWRDSQSAVGGMADTTVAPGVSGYGDKTVNTGNESRLHRSYAAPHDPPRTEPPIPGSEFGKEPASIQSIADGKEPSEERKDEHKH